MLVIALASLGSARSPLQVVIVADVSMSSVFPVAFMAITWHVKLPVGGGGVILGDWWRGVSVYVVNSKCSVSDQISDGVACDIIWVLEICIGERQAMSLSEYSGSRIRVRNLF